MGTSTPRRYNGAKKKMDELFPNDDNIDINKLNRILSKVMFPKNGNSKMTKTIINSLSSDDFCYTISKVIKISHVISKNGIAGLGIAGYSGKSFNEKVQILSDIICDSENPILKQTIIEVLSKENDSPELNIIDAIKCVLSIIAIFTRDMIESFLYEEAAMKDPQFDDETLQTEIDHMLNKQIGINIDLNSQNILLENYENIPLLKEKFSGYAKNLLQNIWG